MEELSLSLSEALWLKAVVGEFVLWHRPALGSNWLCGGWCQAVPAGLETQGPQAAKPFPLLGGRLRDSYVPKLCVTVPSLHFFLWRLSSNSAKSHTPMLCFFPSHCLGLPALAPAPGCWGGVCGSCSCDTNSQSHGWLSTVGAVCCSQHSAQGEFQVPALGQKQLLLTPACEAVAPGAEAATTLALSHLIHLLIFPAWCSLALISLVPPSKPRDTG